MNAALMDKIKLHDSFWKREPMVRPLLSFSVGGDRFPYDKMRASRVLMQPGLTITPDMVDVDAAFAELERNAKAAGYDRVVEEARRQLAAHISGL